jgi:hypothetical protein
MRRPAACLLLLSLAAAPLLAQDQDRAQDAIRIGITYRPGTRPGLVVLPGTGLDSVRAIVRRDLDYSDRFQMIEAGSGGGGGAVNYSYYRTQFNADHAVELVAAPGGVSVRLHDLAAGRVRNQQVFALPAPTAGDFRMAVHRIADEVTRWADGTEGYASSRLLILSGDRIYLVDSDGADLAPVTPAGEWALSARALRTAPTSTSTSRRPSRPTAAPSPSRGPRRAVPPTSSSRMSPRDAACSA